MYTKRILYLSTKRNISASNSTLHKWFGKQKKLDFIPQSSWKIQFCIHLCSSTNMHSTCDKWNTHMQISGMVFFTCGWKSFNITHIPPHIAWHELYIYILILYMGYIIFNVKKDGVFFSSRIESNIYLNLFHSIIFAWSPFFDILFKKNLRKNENIFLLSDGIKIIFA